LFLFCRRQKKEGPVSFRKDTTRQKQNHRHNLTCFEQTVRSLFGSTCVMQSQCSTGCSTAAACACVASWVPCHQTQKPDTSLVSRIHRLLTPTAIATTHLTPTPISRTHTRAVS
jgi:hypothetical protein